MPRLVKGVRWVDIEPTGLASRVELDPAAFTRPPRHPPPPSDPVEG